MSQTSAVSTSAAWLGPLLQADPPDFEVLAAQLQGCGMAAEAALCHSWSLLPPSAELWQQKRSSWLQRIAGGGPEEAPAQAAGPEGGEAAVAAELEAIQAQLDGGDVAAACARIARLSHSNALAPHLCNRAAMLHTRLGDWWQAERWYRTSLVQLAGQPQCWFALASLLLRQQACDEALEAASVGLQLEPDHPWGLKLRQHALAGLQAEQTLQHLAALGQLPFPREPREPGAASGFAASRPDSPAPLAQKLLLQGLLRIDPERHGPLRIWCVGPASHRIVAWLSAQRLLPQPTLVQVFADPDADHCELASALPEVEPGLVIEPSLPLYRLGQQELLPRLTILAPLSAMAWPRLTARLIQQATPLLLDRRSDLALPQHRVVLQTPDWRLAVAAGTG